MCDADAIKTFVLPPPTHVLMEQLAALLACVEVFITRGGISVVVGVSVDTIAFMKVPTFDIVRDKLVERPTCLLMSISDK